MSRPNNQVGDPLPVRSTSEVVFSNSLGTTVDSQAGRQRERRRQIAMLRKRPPQACPLQLVLIFVAIAVACTLLLVASTTHADVAMRARSITSGDALSLPTGAIAASPCRVCGTNLLSPASDRCHHCFSFIDISHGFYGRTVLSAAPAPAPIALRAAAAVFSTTLSADLLATLQSLPLLALNESELATGAGGFERSVDNRVNPGHIYYEGYAHALLSGHCGAVTSMNPRWGYDFAKPAAPPFLLAFFEAVRRANAPLLAAVELRLGRVGTAVSATLASFVREGRAFADLALQTHYGDDEAGVWHTDAPNSLLHMAVSVRGTRSLLYRVSEGQRAGGEPLAERRLRQAGGDVYVSNPASFAHAVEYAGAPTHAERILAIQVRGWGGNGRLAIRDDEREGLTESDAQAPRAP